MSLLEIAAKLGKDYKKSKTAEKALAAQRAKFFEAITEEIESTESLAQKVIDAPAGDPDEYIQRWYPGWRFVGEDDQSRIIIEEDPKFKKFVVANPVDKMVYQRNITQSGPSLDDDLLREDNPELWERITVPTRELLPLDQLSSEDLAALQPYLVPAPLRVKLEPPRKAKPGELE